MSESELLALSKDGLNIAAYKQNKEHFSKCGVCLCGYSITNPPALLECGHLIHEGCHKPYPCCAYCYGNPKKVIKATKYLKLL